MKITSALIDIGGSSIKVSIRDNIAGIVVTEEIEIIPTVDKSHIFLNPVQLYKSVIQAMNRCSEKLTSGTKINKIYISSLRQGFCIVDNLQELTPIYLNSDTSGIWSKKEIENYGSSKIYEETGHWFAPQLTLPKLIQLFHVRPELKKENHKILFVHDWLAWRFTKIVFTEMTLVSAGQMAKVFEKRPNFELLESFGIPSSLVPEVKEFATPVSPLNSGTISELSSCWTKAELHVGGGDSHFLHLGASGNKVGKLVISAGSSTPISLLSKELGISSILQPWKSTSFDKAMYFLEGNVGYPGTYFGWLNKNASSLKIKNTINMESVSKAATVFGCCNMWNEEKWNSRPAFSILGDFTNSDSSNLGLGLTLDYAFALSNQILELISDQFEIDQIILTGGGANAQLQTLLRSLIEIPIDLITTKNSVNNIFDNLNENKLETFSYEDNTVVLDSQTIEYLKLKAKKHALLYSEIEGSREVLKNAS